MNQVAVINNAAAEGVRHNAGLVPANLAEAMKLAEVLAGSSLVPVALQKKPADCFLVIEQSVRWQMSPFAVAQECSVIQGRLMYGGKLVAAVVNTNGYLTRRLSYEYRGAGQDRTITVSGLLRGESIPRTVEVLLKNAATNAKVWQTQPDQQLMYHGARVWARRHTPELMLGVWSPEEFDETSQDAPQQRQNPHVSRAEDMVDIPPDDSEYWWPPATDDRKVLVARQREIANEINKEMYAIESAARLRIWKSKTEEKAKDIKPEWLKMLSGKYKEHLLSLEQAEEHIDQQTGEIVAT